MNAKKTAQQILNEVGGEKNVVSLTHCVTRLRFNLNSLEHVDENRIKNIPGVVGVVNKGGQFQVIIGQEVVVVYNELLKLGNFHTPAKSGEEDDKKEKKGVFNRILDTIAGIFSPIMSIIAGAGMIKALLSILKAFSLINTDGNLYYFLSFIADSAYYFLPIILAVTASKKFHCNTFMAMLMGAMLIHPNFTALKDTASFVSVIGLPVKMVSYSSSVIPIILIVFVLSYVERFVEKITPSIIKFIAKPLLTILIMAPLALVVLGPLGSLLGDGLVSVLLAIEGFAPWVLPTVIGAFMPFLVMTGMHYSLLPAYVNSLSSLGYETIIGPGNLPSNIAQGAAALCVAVKTKNKEFRQLCVSSGVTALLGVTEPALFGVNLRLKKPLIAMTIGGGLGGLYAGITGVQRYGGGGAGLAALGLYVGENPKNLINALISAAIAFVVTFVLMWYIGFEDVPVTDEGAKQEQASAPAGGAPEQAKLGAEGQAAKADPAVYSPSEGELIPLSQVKDEAFSSGMMGKGMAVKVKNGKVYSPADAVVSTVFETKHAIGLVADNGAEILIHAGIDTVELGGKHFTAHVHNGDKVKKGDLLMEFDREAVEKAGYDTVTIVVVCNSDQFRDVKEEAPRTVKPGDKMYTVVV